MSGDGSVAGGYPPIWEMGNTCNYLIIWVQIYKKEKIQRNNSKPTGVAVIDFYNGRVTSMDSFREVHPKFPHPRDEKK